MTSQLTKHGLIAVFALFMLIATGCSPVNAENSQSASHTNPANTQQTKLTASQSDLQSPAKKSDEANSIWVRLAKPTCH